MQCGVKETIGRRQTLLMDQRAGGGGVGGRSSENFTSSPMAATQREQQQPNRPAGQQPVTRDRSLAARNNRPTNRYSREYPFDIITS